MPFKHQGRSREEGGIDCVGLLILVGRVCGLGDVNYDNRAYGKVASSKLLIGECERHLAPVEQYQPGDVVMCWFTQPSEPHHIGIVTDKNTIIHTHEGIGRVVEHSLTDGWKRHICRAYKYKGVE